MSYDDFFARVYVYILIQALEEKKKEHWKKCLVMQILRNPVSTKLDLISSQTLLMSMLMRMDLVQY